MRLLGTLLPFPTFHHRLLFIRRISQALGYSLTPSSRFFLSRQPRSSKPRNSSTDDPSTSQRRDSHPRFQQVRTSYHRYRFSRSHNQNTRRTNGRYHSSDEPFSTSSPTECDSSEFVGTRVCGAKSQLVTSSLESISFSFLRYDLSIVDDRCAERRERSWSQSIYESRRNGRKNGQSLGRSQRVCRWVRVEFIRRRINGEL